MGALRFHTLVGTGGVGSGSFFRLVGDRTLGREESRAGRFVDQRDYCKLHIISQYPQALLGEAFTCLPIGRVGDDAVGQQLIDEMARVGMDPRHVRALPGEQTLFSFCFLYPDNSGGNLTVDNSASGRVDAAAVAEAAGDIARAGARGIALAAPEVPLGPRAELLRLASEHGLFRVGSFLTEELPAATEMGLLASCDLIALNRDEAAALAQVDPATGAADIARKAVDRLRECNAAMLASITAGGDGSWSWDGDELHHVPALSVEVSSTAGAGDCHLGSLLAGLAGGLSTGDAQHLATLAAALSVTSPHTIDERIRRPNLVAFARELGSPLPDAVWAFLTSD